jgi:hypothetical protein
METKRLFHKKFIATIEVIDARIKRDELVLGLQTAMGLPPVKSELFLRA